MVMVTGGKYELRGAGQVLGWPIRAEKQTRIGNCKYVTDTGNFCKSNTLPPLPRSAKNVVKVVGATSSEGFLI